MTNHTDILATADRVAKEVLNKHAAEVDENATYPKASMEALGKAGLLGILSAPDVGGSGADLRTATAVIERLAKSCGSTAMITTMHYCGTTVVEKFGTEEARRELASGNHITTLAFSEAGSRSHFWSPVSTAEVGGNTVCINAKKSMVTSAKKASSYVWSSKPCCGSEMSSLWLVPASSEGLDASIQFNGLGLRGNDSRPISAENVNIPLENRLGNDAQGFQIMMENVIPVFALLIASGAVGIMAGASESAIAHVSKTRFEHLDDKLADFPTIRAQVARIQITTDAARCMIQEAVAAVEEGREDAMLRVLEAKAIAGENALQVTDGAMRVCGGAAFRKDLGVDRYFRDSRAANVMAPTTDQLYDFIGKAVCGMPLF